MRFFITILLTTCIYTPFVIARMIPTVELCNNSGGTVQYEHLLNDKDKTVHSSKSLWPQECQIIKFDKETQQNHYEVKIYHRFGKSLYTHFISNGELHSINSRNFR